MNLILFSLLIPVITIVLILILLLIWKPGEKESANEYERLKKLLPQSSKKRDLTQSYLKAYLYLKEIPGVRILLVRLHNRFGIIYAENEKSTRARAAKYTLITIAGSGAVFILALLLSNSWTTRLAVLVVSLYVAGFLSDQFISKAQRTALTMQDRMITKVRDQYQKTGMVVESLEQVSEVSKPIIATHAIAIAEVLNASDPETELYAYYDAAPNRHMKQLAGISYKIAELGDTKDDKQESNYLTALNNIREEINMDLGRRVTLDRLLSGLIVMAVAPILFVDPIRRWGEANFPIISNYYNSAWGTYSLVLLYLIFITVYVILRIIKNVEGDAQGVKEEGKWMKRLLQYRPIRRLVLRLQPSEHQYRYVRVMQTLEKANSRLTISSFYLIKLLVVVAVFIGVTVMQIGIHQNVKHNAIYPNKAISVTKNSTASQQMLRQERYAFESLLIGEIISKKIPSDQVLSYVIERSTERGLLESGTDVEEYAQGIAERISKYKQSYFKWYELLIAALLAFFAYHLPDLYLAFRAQARKWEMQNEVDSFNTSVELLSKIDRISVYEILEWMERDSYIFREALTRCLLDYEAGDQQALEQLKDQVRFEPMEILIERLEEAAYRTPIRQAFSDLALERSFRMAQRKEHYEKVITQKATIGKTIAMIPLGATVFLYLLIPFVFLAFQQLGDLTAITGGM